MKWRSGIGALGICLLAVSASHAAEAVLKDRKQLSVLLKDGQTVTVIDGRGPQARAQKPIPFSLVPGEMTIDFAGLAVVIADSDGKALNLARRLSRGGKREVYAVRGGYGTWARVRSANQETGTAQSGSSGSEDFIIPSNTCEQGEALQVYGD